MPGEFQRMAPRMRQSCISAATCSASNSTRTTGGKELVGWVLESPGRGTLTIITSCLFTSFLCTWVVIHSRVEKRPSLQRLHKIALFFKAIVAPEFIAVEGLQEFSQAKRMVKECAELTGGRFELIHAFYIGMLALRYRTSPGNRVIWPNQYTWLLQQRLTEWKDHEDWGLSKADIRDKSNANGTVKLAAFCQVCWFVAQSIMRAAHGLPLCQLESMTLSYIPLFTVTYFFWWIKPKDVMRPSVVNLPDMSPGQKATFESMAISHTFDDESTADQESLWNIWYLTPRVFEKEAADKALQEAERMATLHEEQHKRVRKIEQEIENGNVRNEARITQCNSMPPLLPPKETVLAYWDPDLYHSKLWPITCLFGASFGALHLISWDTAFPTFVELWLWRIAAITSIVSMLVFMQYEKVVLKLGGPLTMISLLSPILYLLSRLAMMAGVIAAFRASDPAVYDTYVVSNYWVHIL